MLKPWHLCGAGRAGRSPSPHRQRMTSGLVVRGKSHSGTRSMLEEVLSTASRGSGHDAHAYTPANIYEPHAVRGSSEPSAALDCHRAGSNTRAALPHELAHICDRSPVPQLLLQRGAHSGSDVVVEYATLSAVTRGPTLQASLSKPLRWRDIEISFVASTSARR